MAKKGFSARDMLSAGRRPSATPQPESTPNTTPSPLVAQASSELVVKSETYQRATVYLVPDQRVWLRQTAKGLPEGLSASDIVRLSLQLLRESVTDGRVDLVEQLTTQAHDEAGRLTGRRNRGLPPRTPS